MDERTKRKGLLGDHLKMTAFIMVEDLLFCNKKKIVECKARRAWTQRKCPDCPHCPALCQTVERDCRSKWHEPSFDNLRSLWVEEKTWLFSCSDSSHISTWLFWWWQWVSSVPWLLFQERSRGSINKWSQRGDYRSKL